MHMENPLSAGRPPRGRRKLAQTSGSSELRHVHRRKFEVVLCGLITGPCHTVPRVKRDGAGLWIAHQWP